MSQIAKLFDGTAAADVETLTGNIGGAVGASATFNINVVGGTNISTTGTPATNTLTINNTLVTTTNAILYGAAGNTIASLGPLTNGQLAIGSTGAAPVAASLTPGPGIAVTLGAGSITIGAWGGGISWSAKGASDALVVNNGYFCNAGAALSFSLPAISSVGSVVALSLDGATSWTITQAAGQRIRMGSLETTAGVGGSLASTAQGDTVCLLCVTANTRWVVIWSMGNITVV